MNVAEYCNPVFPEPLGLILFMEEMEQALQLYLKRMKIDEYFWDLLDKAEEVRICHLAFLFFSEIIHDSPGSP